MSRRLRHAAASAALAAVCSLAIAAHADGYVTTDIANIVLGTSMGSIDGNQQYHISTGGDGSVQYRWLDTPGKATTITANGCSDLSEFGRNDFDAGSTSYKTLFFGLTSQCFRLRGKTQAGQGGMANPHDGRVKR
jgi:hypothetical protein